MYLLLGVVHCLSRFKVYLDICTMSGYVRSPGFLEHMTTYIYMYVSLMYGLAGLQVSVYNMYVVWLVWAASVCI